MLRIFDGDEISRTANDLRSTIRQCLKQWQAALAEKRCSMVVDLNVTMPVLCQAEDTLPLIVGMFDLAVSRLATGDELSVIGCRGPHAVELEIADAGTPLACEMKYDRLTFPPRSAIHDRRLIVLQNLAMSFGGRVWATPCPQGGMAWTLRLPSRVTTKRAA